MEVKAMKEHTPAVHVFWSDEPPTCLAVVGKTERLERCGRYVLAGYCVCRAHWALRFALLHTAIENFYRHLWMTHRYLTRAERRFGLTGRAAGRNTESPRGLGFSLPLLSATSPQETECTTSTGS